MRHILSVALACTFLFASTAYAELKVAVFDLQVVAMESEALKSAQNKMRKEYDSKKKELEKKRDELTKLNEKLRAAQPTQAQIDDFTKKEKAYSESAALYLQNIQAAELSIRQTMDKIIIQAAAQLAKERGYDLILDSGAAVYYPDSMNVTKDMLSQVNKVWKTKK